MKHVGKALIIAGALSLCGCVFLGLSTNMLYQERKNGTARTSGEYEEKEYTTPVSGIDSIETVLTSDQVQVELGDSDDIEIIYYDNITEPDYQISEHNGTLQISRSWKNSGFSLFHVPDINSWWDEEIDRKITIRVPESYAGKYDLELSSGSISLKDLEIQEELYINGTSGKVDLGNLTCGKNVRVSMSSGSIDMDNVEADGDMKIDITSGACRLQELMVSGNLEVWQSSGSTYMYNVVVNGTLKTRLTSGKCTAQDTTAGDVYVDTTSGSIQLDRVTLTEGIYVSATSGSITVSLTDEMGNYKITSDVTSGSCNLPNNFGNGDKYINVDVTSGIVKFSFEE